MSARVRFAVAPLLVALLCGTAASAFAERNDNGGNHGDKERERAWQTKQRDDRPRDSYDYRRERQEQWQREQQRSPRSYPQPGYPSSPRSYPQPGYPNPIQPGGLRHDPYSRQPGRDPYRDESSRRYRDDDDHRGGYKRDYGQNGAGRRDENPGRYTDPGRSNELPGRPMRPVNDVIRQVEGTYGGKVVGVQQAGNDYRVRVLQRDGRVKTVTVPAR